jgi:uncharacterized NAD-dependent epimerase/dehydratase family protein
LETALVLCEGFLGTNTGKTANGLVRFSRRFAIAGVLDSRHAGRDAGEVVDGVPRGIPVFRGLEEALRALPRVPDALIIGVATFGGYLPPEFRPTVRLAVDSGMSVFSGLHEHLSEDPEFAALARERGVRLVDVRKPRPLSELRQFTDLARRLPCARVPVLGTDGSIGKRTTAILLTEALNAAAVRATFVATGQTGLLQGAEFGVPLDSIPGDFMVGELESEIVRASEAESPEVIVVEGQGSISHPAYVCGTRAILNASAPSGIVLVHAPGRRARSYRREQLALPMPDPAREIALLEAFSSARVIGLAVNHEGLEREDVVRAASGYRASLRIPACDPLVDGVGELVTAVKALL